MEKLSVYLLGGAVDSHRDKKQKMVAPRRHSIIPSVFEKNFPEEKPRFELICMKDGRDVDLFDLELLKDKLNNDDDLKLIITGIELMSDLLDYLQKDDNGPKVLIRGSKEMWNPEKHKESLSFALKTIGERKTGIVYQKKLYSAKIFRSQVLLKS